MGFPHGHRKTTTVVAGLRTTGMVAPMVLDGPINGDWLEAYVAQVLVPELRIGDVVIMDNLSILTRANLFVVRKERQRLSWSECCDCARAARHRRIGHTNSFIAVFPQ